MKFKSPPSHQLRIGDGLSTALPFQAGDFIYVPQWSLHQPVNDGDEPVEMIVARNTPVEIVTSTPDHALPSLPQLNCSQMRA